MSAEKPMQQEPDPQPAKKMLSLKVFASKYNSKREVF